ncbi:hypothetical protein TraAM80_01866 [Trypanosoma rangeli]|uniref:RRM domain-containing protein n=1 Tax=Trypanosoma rangeli TaxID=5698 RepID=A0A422NWM0_TRYRA|nr:uncharacterized protein TraAM80_01866 [Trypanosoma rangeli]RNF09841.1 hypothetical protein TraAM80_01866 [Trypanosoma rangeli]|eukprot:RNF09841.1 hypothetical protein TraAM80_01866 [Trypanosoma rangeli]
MGTRDDARVVHVSVEDQSAVLVEDVHDWLRIIGDVEETKVQYDTARRCPFYWVRFKHASAAQLAVNYLDGEKLKNHVIHISSNVYAKRLPAEVNAEDLALAKRAEGEQQVVANPNMPLNHQMPPDLRMDTLLVDSIPALLSTAAKDSEHHGLVRQLRQLQESYCHVQEAIREAEGCIQKTDEEVGQLLRGSEASSGSVGTGSCEKVQGVRVTEFTRSRRISNAVQIPMTLLDPAGLIVRFTRHIGPVTDYSFSVSLDGRSFRTIVEFFHEDDAVHALQLLKRDGSGGAAIPAAKRPRLERDAEEALSPLCAFDWGEDASVDALRPLDLAICCHAAHLQATHALQRCLQPAASSRHSGCVG